MDIKDQYIRNFLRVIAAIILIAYTIDIVANKIIAGKIYLDVNDGIAITACVGLLLTIEGVKAYVQRKLGKKE